MKDKLNRREFIELSGKGMLGAGASASGVEKLVNQFSTSLATTQNQGGNNSKSAGSVINLPEGGGAVKGIGEKFQANPFTGTANFSVPIYTSAGRGGFNPELSLQYSSGNGNGAFGMGWGLSVPMVSRKTDKGIPTYNDEQDVFLLSGAEDLVPFIEKGEHKKRSKKINGENFEIYYYRPRVEGLFARIEFWRKGEIELKDETTQSFWKITTKENITSIYGYNSTSQLRHSSNGKVFEWMLELTYDAKGNYILYTCKQDTAEELKKTKTFTPPIYEAHRKFEGEVFQLYLQTIEYGNINPEKTQNFQTLLTKLKSGFQENNHFFQVVFDYNIHVDSNGNKMDFEVSHKDFKDDETFNNYIDKWNLRNDRFSYYRAGFEIRNYRLCQRVLMFHDIPNEGMTLVRSTDFHYEENEFNGMSILTKVTQRGYRKVEGTHYSEEKYLKDIPNVAYEAPYVHSDTYAIKSFPPIEFTYSSFEPQKQKFKTMSADGGDMPPSSLNDPNFTMVDLFGTGMPDVLNTSPYGYYYWKNHGDGTFSSRRTLKEMPADVRLEMVGVGFGDMAGDGQADLLVHRGNAWGFFETNGKAGWKNFRPYKNYPSFNLDDPSIRLLDLTGDGKADVLRTDQNSFVWFPCEGEDGFGAPKHIRRKRDLEEFPDIDFSDPRIRLADMTGDGLNDIVMVHNGRIDYWANMGNGNFSRRITMHNTPRFGATFNPSRLFLTDIDGTGNADLLYVESGKIHFCFNQSGNQWSDKEEIIGTPAVTDLDSIQIQDVLGCGCAQILWTSNFRGAGRSNYMYLDFTGGVKPNLLIEMNNNMGATTKAKYKPSTHFYRLDEKENHKRSWVSPLPFPVQVLEKVEKIDHVSRTKLVTNYRYHHGFYDGKEREFRGFAFVEQWDTEYFKVFNKENLHDNIEKRNANQAFHVPPVLTKTWFHTGMYESIDLEDAFDGLISSSSDVTIDIHRLFQEDYYKQGNHDHNLEDSVFDLSKGQVDTASMSEAYRALRGQVLRQEVYAKDESDDADKPYTITESNAKVVLVQAKGKNKHAVYFVHPHESLSYHFERNMDDPRVVQELTLQVDEYGNMLESVSIAYPRKKYFAEYLNEKSNSEYKEPNNPDWCKEQFQMYGTFAQNTIFNKPKGSKNSNDKFNYDYYYLGIPCETKSYEINGLGEQFKFSWIGDFKAKKLKHADFLNLKSQTQWEFHEKPSSADYGIRLLSWSRSYFKKASSADKINCINRNWDDAHDLCDIDALALPYESFQAVFHQDHLDKAEVFNREVTNVMLEKGGYTQLADVPKMWWIPSVQQSFDVSKFYLPTKSCDPFGNISSINYDEINLLMKSAKDALGNEVVVLENDYVTLQPSLIKDPNNNAAKVRFDALGLVAGSGVMGKWELNGDEEKKWERKADTEGDYCEQFESLWEYNQIIPHVDTPYTFGSGDGSIEARKYLKDATTAMIYDLWGNIRKGKHEPPTVYSIAREEHQKEDTPIQRQLMYFDGLGREVQTKIEAEPDSVGERWINSGWKIYNNKGKPVQQYEPFYSYTAEYLDIYEMSERMTKEAKKEGKNNREKIEYGVSPTIFYDPLERVIATIHPDGSFEKVEFDAWYQKTWDKNDTVCWNPDDAEKYPVIQKWREANPDFKTWKKRIEEESTAALDTALTKTLEHQDSPSIAHLDSLGRPFLTITHNGAFESDPFKTRIALDIQGNDLHIIDPRDNQLFTHTFNMLQQQLVVDSKDAGVKRLLQAVDEQPIWSKDARGTIVVPEYDKLRRPLSTKITFIKILKDANGNPILDEDEKVKKVVQSFKAVVTLYDYDKKTIEAFSTDEEKEEEEKRLRQLAQKNNAIGQALQIKDQSGIIDNLEFDFKGNVKKSQAGFWKEFKDHLNVENLKKEHIDTGLGKQNGKFETTIEFDALNRTISSTAPDSSIFYPKYNRTNQLKKLKVKLKGEEQTFVSDIQYNAKGQRDFIIYSEGQFKTHYEYEKETFRLQEMKTTRSGEFLQHCLYTYDPVGNITQIEDKAYERIFNRGQKVDPICRYRYDALYRLVEATGRQHNGNKGRNFQNNNNKHTQNFEASIKPTDKLTNGKDLINYTQKFEYDKSGNITKIQLTPKEGSNAYTRIQKYNATNNQILKSYLQNNDTTAKGFTINHDANGNIQGLTHLKIGDWDFSNQLKNANLDKGAEQKVEYVYGSGGNRTRKIILDKDGEKLKERLYLGGYELLLDKNGTTLKETLHVQDDTSRLALVEWKKGEASHLSRYQLNNHLGSCCLETDEGGNRISYEEYFAYGGSAFIAANNQTEVDRKRYRYSGKERDDETGLYYYGARYYAPWMGRWMKADPIGKGDGLNVFGFVRGNPILKTDLIGQKSERAGSLHVGNSSLDTNSDKIISHVDKKSAIIINPKPLGKGIKRLLNKIKFNLKKKNNLSLQNPEIGWEEVVGRKINKITPEALQEVANNVSSFTWGAFDAWLENNSINGKYRRSTPNTSGDYELAHRVGHLFGDLLSLVQGLSEMYTGIKGMMAGGGITVTTKGIGSIVGVPIAIASGAIAYHGAIVTGRSGRNLWNGLGDLMATTGSSNRGTSNSKKVSDIELLHSEETVTSGKQYEDIKNLTNDELIESVLNPKDGNYVLYNPETSKAHNGNTRLYELKRRNINIEIPVKIYKPNNSDFFPDLK